LTEMQFEWLDFDGDDCFGDFHINIASGTDTRRFDFGSCAVSGLRKISKFFKDGAQTTVSSGFRHPDIRYYDVHRSDDGYRLVIRFEGSGLYEQFHIKSPLVQINDEFLKLY
jgi:hypothetical protein